MANEQGTMELAEIISMFDKLQQKELNDAVKFLTRNPSTARAIFMSLRNQSQKDVFRPMFEWLYKCVLLKSSSPELFHFCLQFIPELVVIYLHSVYEDLGKVKANAEALLIAYLSEIEKGTQLQVPTLSRSSIYHQCPSQLSQPILTEAVLQRHNEVEIMPKSPTVVGVIVTVNNRLQFLSAAFEVVNDHIMLFSTEAKVFFCQSCIRLSLQGMGTLGSELDPFREVLAEYSKDVPSMKRISISDSFMTSLLRGVRICLFQPCHVVATQALQAIKLRSEYELLNDSVQTCHTLSRLASGIKSQKLQLNALKYMSYHGPGSPEFTSDPANIHTTLNSLILHNNLSGPPPTGNVFSKSTTV